MEQKEIDNSSSSFISTSRWWSKETVAVVTGANKGIGFSLVKQLSLAGLTVVLTARDKDRGQKAVELLRSQGLLLHFRRLDVSDPSSIAAFVSWFRTNFGVLDILVNNAAVSFNELEENSVEHADDVINTNFYGAKTLTEALLPFFRRSDTKSRILNISSRLGSINKMKNPNMKLMLLREDLTEAEIEKMVKSFLQDVKEGKLKNKGWPEVWTDYAVSKMALNSYSKVLAKRYAECGLSVNCFCPGFTQTAMTGGKGTHTADDAALVGARLALLSPQELPSGKFFVGFNPGFVSKL